MPRSQEGLTRLIERDVADPRIVAAFRSVPREGFVPEGLKGEAYRDRPVPIPHEQTTSQPSLIARMIDAARVQGDDRVLEVGTGYGFQTALLAKLAREVISVERHAGLAEAARKNLKRAGIDNASVIVGNGWDGAPGAAPFEAIVVAAAADEVPRALVEQLAEGGRLVIPVKRGGSDDVLLFEKKEGELIEMRLVTPARFVPLVQGGPE